MPFVRVEFQPLSKDLIQMFLEALISFKISEGSYTDSGDQELPSSVYSIIELKQVSTVV